MKLKDLLEKVFADTSISLFINDSIEEKYASKDKILPKYLDWNVEMIWTYPCSDETALGITISE